jgi:hypothetical protein
METIKSVSKISKKIIKEFLMRWLISQMISILRN